MNSFDGVSPSLSKQTCLKAVGRDFFSFATINSYWCVCSYFLFLLGTTIADGKRLMKVMYKGKV